MEETNSQEDGSNNVIDEDTIDIGEDNNEIELNNNVLQRLKQNDPTIINLYIRGIDSVDWEKDGDCIARNTHIKRLRLYSGYPSDWGEEGPHIPSKQQLRGFFSCIYRNNSIKALSLSSIQIVNSFSGGLIEGLQGHPSITGLEIRCGTLGSIGCEALGKVLEHPTSKMRDLSLFNCHLDDKGFGIVCDGLLGNSSISSLSFTSNKICTIGWSGLSKVLRDANRKMSRLNLSDTEMNDDTVNKLVTSLCDSQLEALDLSSNYSISSAGWQILFNQISTSIIQLNLQGNNIDNANLAALANNIGTLKVLDLSGNSRTITPSGWSSFFDSLETRGTQLKEFHISDNNVGGVGAAALVSLLGSMTTLKVLDMNNISNICPRGWETLFTLSQGSNLDLVNLSLRYNSIDDRGVQLLVQFVSNMSSLKELHLDYNGLVTPTGWQALSDLLQRSNVALEKLDIEGNNVNNDTVVALAVAMEHVNKTLKSLCLYQEPVSMEEDEEGDNLITEGGWEAIRILLCNRNSIIHTYNSNHTLQELVHDSYFQVEMNLPDDLTSYLAMNQNKDKQEVARQKVLQTHASNIQELLDMELEVMPTAIAWIGRPLPIGWEGKQVSGLSLLYNEMRRLPDLFDSSGQKRPGGAKRKRDL